jgi:hypothetical protein
MKCLHRLSRLANQLTGLDAVRKLTLLLTVKIQYIVTFFGILIFLQPSLLATPQEPELYDPREYFNRGSNTYEMMDHAKELTTLLEARVEHLFKIKIQDAKDTYKGLDGERFEGKLNELLELINSTQKTWKEYALAAASEERHGGGSGASLRYSYTYCYKLIDRIKELRIVLK